MSKLQEGKWRRDHPREGKDKSDSDDKTRNAEKVEEESDEFLFQGITVQAVINNVTKTFTLNNLSSVRCNPNSCLGVKIMADNGSIDAWNGSG